MASDVESHPLFSLLTDALRAGPGSPEWHQAVSKLRTEGLADSDEYRLLVQVREDLESGRDYRSIRAGAGFTRKVMEAVEEEKRSARTKKPAAFPLGTTIAAISIIAIFVALGYFAWQLFLKPPPATTPNADELAGLFFPTASLDGRFEGSMPKDWRTVGGLSLEAGKTGLKPSSATPPSTSPTDTVGGAVVAPVTVPADEPFAVEVTLRPGRVADDLIVQLFISSEGDFSATTGASAKELVWLLQGNRQKVAQVGETDTRVVFPHGGDSLVNAGGKPEPITVRINVNREFAAAFNGNQKLWAGPNGLSAKPRSVGVRFLRADPTKPIADPPVVTSIRVLKK